VAISSTQATNDTMACRADRVPSNDMAPIIARFRFALDRYTNCPIGGWSGCV
jgi:hypothetical protein